jgi:integrase
MSLPCSRTPSYRLHKASGQAVVTLSGRDFYLGRYGTPESRAEYDRRIAEWLAGGRMLVGHLRNRSAGATDITVSELLLAFVDWAETYYRKGGRPTSEVGNVKCAVRALRELYGPTPARDFGPLELKTVRQAIIATGVCRNEVNRRVRIIVRAFRWAVAEGMIPPSVHHGLQAVPGLRRGRCEVRESEPVGPIPDAFVDVIEPYVSRQVWAMVQLQRHSGMRPGEVTIMRTIDIDTSGRVWAYTPGRHKTEHHGRTRTIYLGPRAQDVLRPWLRTELEAYLFQPREAMAARRAAMRRDRKTPVQPSQQNRRKRRPRWRPGEVYSPRSYHRAIGYAIKRVNKERAARGEPPIPHWHPNQLRHNAATRLRKEFGLDIARVVLGHASPVVTEVYAELDGAKAAEAMARMG